MVLVAIFMLPLFAIISFYILPLVENSILDEKRQQIKLSVKEAVAYVDNLHTLVVSGKLTREEAEGFAKDYLSNLRFGDQDYFFAADLNLIMIVHPLRKEHINKSAAEISDAEGMKIYREIYNLIMLQGEGFIEYKQVLPGKSTVAPKLTYSKLSPGFGWIVSSGAYYEDVNHQINILKERVYIVYGFTTLSVFVLAYFVFASFTKRIKSIDNAVALFAQNDQIEVKLESKLNDEIGRLTMSFNTMIKTLQSDMKEKSRLYHELSSAKEKSEELGKVKSALFSNLSHELRTPLNGILGLTQIVQEELTDPELVTLTQKIVFSSRRLMMTFNSLLDYTQLETDEIAIHTKNVHLDTVISSVMRTFWDVADEKGLVFDLDIVKADTYVLADEYMLTRSLNYLLDNAIKFTETGKVTIKIREHAPIEGRVQISIIDTGIGIPSANLDKIFQEFTQVSSGMNRSHEGAGIGLTNALRMVEKCGGILTVNSTVGIGSTFFVELILNTNQPN